MSVRYFKSDTIEKGHEASMFKTVEYVIDELQTLEVWFINGVEKLNQKHDGNISDDLIKIFINEGFTECSKQEFIKG
jgi:hypothetical protein